MRIFVTGAAGFVAEHLIPELYQLGHQVIGCDRKSRSGLVYEEYIQCDLVNNNIYKNKIKNVDFVIHLAAARADWGISREEFWHDNVKATEALIQVGLEAGIKSWMFVSSVSTMPQNTSELLDDQAPYAPINDYGESKMLAEKAFIKMQQDNPEISLTIIRPTVLYGPSDPEYTGMYRAVDNNIFRLIDGIYSNRFAIVGNGKTIKTTAYVKNFAKALMFLITDTPGCEIYVYADQPSTQTGELVKIIRGLLGKNGQGLKIPLFFALPLSVFGDMFSKITDINFPITKARVETFNRPTNFIPRKLINKGFTFPYTVEEALRETVNWYIDLKKNHNKNYLFFTEKIGN